MPVFERLRKWSIQQKVAKKFGVPKNTRSSHSEVFLEKGVLKICSKFTGEHPCQSAISIKLLRKFIEIALWHGCSQVNLLDIFRTPFLKNTSGRLLLKNHFPLYFNALEQYLSQLKKLSDSNYKRLNHCMYLMSQMLENSLVFLNFSILLTFWGKKQKPIKCYIFSASIVLKLLTLCFSVH